MRKALAAVVAFLCVIATGIECRAQQQGPACVKRSDLVKHLAGKYQEAPTAIGLADNGALIEVFAAADGSTWTVLVTMPNGISCMVATGQQWQSIPWHLDLEDAGA